MDHRTTRPQPAVRACRLRPYVVALAVLAGLASGPVLAQTGIAQVDRVIDGDTIRVQLDGARDTVRLTDVDTPETRHPTRGVEPDGPEAAADTTARRTGATAIRAFPYSRQREFLQLEAQARAARRGRWADRSR